MTPTLPSQRQQRQDRKEQEQHIVHGRGCGHGRCCGCGDDIRQQREHDSTSVPERELGKRTVKKKNLRPTDHLYAQTSC